MSLPCNLILQQGKDISNNIYVAYRWTLIAPPGDFLHDPTYSMISFVP